MARVLVTCATGTVGSEVTKVLTERGVVFRAGVRRPDDYSGAGSPTAFDFEKPETWGRAFENVERLFLVRPPTVDTDRITDAAAAASRCGVEHVVYLSVLGAEKNPLLPHRRIERHLATLPVSTTFLRASFCDRPRPDREISQIWRSSGSHRTNRCYFDWLFWHQTTRQDLVSASNKFHLCHFCLCLRSCGYRCRLYQSSGNGS